MIELLLDYIAWIKVTIDTLDLDLLQWLIWLFTPIVVMFVLPLVILLLLYGCGVFLQFYKARRRLVDAYSRGYWDCARESIATFWEAQANIWHGYEILGMEKIPSEGAAVLVYYHGAIPIDAYYIIAKLILYKKRMPHCIGDKFLFSVPGFKLLLKVGCVTPGTVEECIKVLKSDKLLLLAPGGVREAQFSDEYYEIIWGKRCGFAKCAIEAKVPIIPLFTQNCREAFRCLSIGRSFFRYLYEKCRLPLCPIYGGFPVKLRTFIGDPIPYDPSLTPQQLAVKVQDAVQDLIDKHQKIPGNVFRALMDRFS
ncbi:DGAT1/2-independent enzyme synthesizing storage lipids-like [Saccoglossus kowalevskii]|uniref:Transmembrane protein 68-like n=1 Tax=Saccoglossus kowalevskii TaxID=10224 RepID=A0ABM0MFT7_SACKO|nr:PREDICTED: transmembrane protein 68-like [Saccoglossus kowalevskii]